MIVQYYLIQRLRLGDSKESKMSPISLAVSSFPPNEESLTPDLFISVILLSFFLQKRLKQMRRYDQ